MKKSVAFWTGAAILGLALPAQSQEATVALGVFVRVNPEDVADFEEALKEHQEWHAAQGDPWSWPAYMALTGEAQEYVVLTGNHSWADFDNLPVDMIEDMMHWARTGARYTVTEELAMWETLTEFSFIPETPAPIVQVLDFQINSGGEEAALHGVAKFKTAVEQSPGAADASFAWLRSVSADRPPQFSIAVYADSFAELGEPGPTPIQILTGAYGETEARQIADGFTAATTPGSTRIWMLRPDLSYTPD